jgi:hypothetical protein
MPTPGSVAFVTVAEPNGALEDQVLLLAESLREWGGRLADAPILCISPRFRLPLRRSTLARFDKLGITHIYRNRNHRFSWHAFVNKPLAVIEARQATDAENLVWLDSDALVLGEPECFLEADSDFAAIFTKGDMATTGPSHPCDAYWRWACSHLELDVEGLPWVESQGARVRYCIQAGVFRIRRESRVVDHYLGNFEKLMDSRVVPSSQGLFLNESTALTLAPFTAGSSWSELPRSHNLVISRIAEDGRAEGLESARVFHYQGWLHPEHRRALLSAFRRCRPDRLAWLEEKVAAAPHRAPPLLRLLRRGLRDVRLRKARRFLAGCRPIDTGPRHGEILGR